MTVIVCIDDALGMLFNKRRQSRDEELRRRILSVVRQNNSKLLMNGYSAGQFERSENTLQDEDFLDNASKDDYCFVENTDITPYADAIDRMVIYKWNRIYPSDMKLSFMPGDNGMKLVSTYDFAGKSHERITEEIWTR